MSIHPTAVVDAKAEIDADAEIGAYAVVGAGVRLSKGVVLRPHSHVVGSTEIGEETTVFPFASVGESPQVLSYRGESTRLEIGARCQIREHVTINPGTPGGGGLTRIGDDNLLMIGAHVGHDCQLGSSLVVGNNVLLAGHVTIEDQAWVSAGVAVQQFVRVGRSAYVAAMAGVMQDLAPYSWSQGHPVRVLRVNRIGLERHGYMPDTIRDIESAFRIVFRSKLRPVEAFSRVRSEFGHSPDVLHMISFLESSKSFARVKR